MQSNTRGIEFALLGKNCKRQIHLDSESEDDDSGGEVLALEKKGEFLAKKNLKNFQKIAILPTKKMPHMKMSTNCSKI